MATNATKTTREWIIERYGPITIETKIVARVAVMNGKAEGVGNSEREAINALYEDLTRKPKDNHPHE